MEAGGDPAGEAEARRGALTLRELFKQRQELDQDTAKRTLDDYSKALELDVYSRIGDVPAVELTSDQIADVLERIERRSRHSAHRARCAISSTFRWAQRKGKLRRNPVVGLGFTVRPIPRDRVFTDAEMRKLWHAIESAPELSPAMRTILKLALLTGLRESEVAGARVAELQLDGASPRWTIRRTRSVAGVKVEGRMKRKRRDHILPLTPAMVALLKQSLELNLGSEYVFPADMTRTRNGKGPRKPHVNGESVSHAMRRLRERIKLEDARVHDFRACLTTWLSDNGFNREVDVRKVVLHHAPTNVTDAKQVIAGEWSLLLAGVAAPRPILTATFQATGERGSGDLPILTLVQPNERFEVADVDSAGLNKVNLPPGRSILLVQGEEEIWQVPLILREG